MPQRASFILALIILLAAGFYFWWHGQAEQKITRKIDLFIETVEFKKLSFKTPEQREESCRAIFAEEVIVSTPSPAPSGTYSESEVIEQLHKFHRYITFFKILEERRVITIDGNTAKVTLVSSMRAAAGPNWSETITGSIIFSFVNGNKGWEVEALSVVAD